VSGTGSETHLAMFQGWGPVYAGLVTGRLPPEFPLSVRQKLSDNLIVLLHPAFLPAR
jgi:hypothetical protein